MSTQQEVAAAMSWADEEWSKLRQAQEDIAPAARELVYVLWRWAGAVVNTAAASWMASKLLRRAAQQAIDAVDS
jgi:hypothetical protein